jgi:hypothetical protein
VDEARFSLLLAHFDGQSTTAASSFQWWMKGGLADLPADMTHATAFRIERVTRVRLD